MEKKNSKTVRQVLKSYGIRDEVINGVKKGYEGICWNNFEEFKNDFLGYDILHKTKMVLMGQGYDSWSSDIYYDVSEGKKFIKILKTIKV